MFSEAAREYEGRSGCIVYLYRIFHLQAEIYIYISFQTAVSKIFYKIIAPQPNTDVGVGGVFNGQNFIDDRFIRIDIRVRVTLY